jgi:(E)-4-hydroxy-3-methylbut-2-enyl-diphosphate synthase
VSYSENKIKRRDTKRIFVGNVAVGGDSDISIQSMTNTNTCDIEATVNQIKRIEKAGADMVRVSVPDFEAVEAFAKIKKSTSIPIISDIHFDYKIALKVASNGSDCLRINPGNIGSKIKIKEVVACAKDHGIPIRIGVNAGSLDKYLLDKYKEPTSEAMVESAMQQISLLDECNFDNFKISVKASNVDMAVNAYTTLSKQTNNPLHLGITEAGVMRAGTVKSAIGLGLLLRKGIGDTLRVSLAEDPVMEVKVGWDILKSLGIRSRGVNLIACPSCSRQNFDVIKVANQLESRLEDLEESIDVAVIGCIVNGPGEAKIANIGITGGSPNHIIYVDGKFSSKISSEEIAESLENAVRKKIKQKKNLLASG